MPEKSGMFDSTADDPRQYPAREFAEYFARFIGNGIFGGGTKLKVSASGTDSNVSVALGYGWINGYMYSVFDTPLVLSIVPATTQDRIDRIVLRLNVSTPVRAIKAMVLQGTPAVNPIAPSITRSGDIYDLSLAQVLVKANTTVILPEQIADERLNTALCGIVTGVVQQADTTAIFNQFQAWLSTKTVEYQQQWSDFLQTVQDQGFATPQYVDNKVSSYGVTTNTGNAYSVNVSSVPTSLVAGLRVTVKINAANTAAATLNVNGLGAKAIKKANGSDVANGSLKANGIYTMVYDGTAFILQGEGGEYGTATAGDVLSGKTIGTELGLANGTIPILTGIRNAQGTAKWGDGALAVYPEQGYQKGGSGDGEIKVLLSQLQAAEAALSAGNIPKDVVLFGLQGTLERLTTADRNAIIAAIVGKGVAASASDSNTVLAQKIGQISTGKKFASGTTTGSAMAGYAITAEVTGLAFKPSMVVAWTDPVLPATFQMSGGQELNVYPNYQGSVSAATYLTRLTAAGTFLKQGEFYIRVMQRNIEQTNVQIHWIAYE